MWICVTYPNLPLEEEDEWLKSQESNKGDGRKKQLRLRLRLDEGVEKWEDRKLFCLVGEKKEKDEKCNLCKLTTIPLLHNK